MDQKKPRLSRSRRNLSAAERRLLDLMALGEETSAGQVYRCQLTDAEISDMDAYVAREAAKVRAKWTPQREAEARGVDVRAVAKLFSHDGRLFPCSQGAEAMSERLFELPTDVHLG